MHSAIFGAHNPAYESLGPKSDGGFNHHRIKFPVSKGTELDQHVPRISVGPGTEIKAAGPDALAKSFIEYYNLATKKDVDVLNAGLDRIAKQLIALARDPPYLKIW